LNYRGSFVGHPRTGLLLYPPTALATEKGIDLSYKGFLGTLGYLSYLGTLYSSLKSLFKQIFRIPSA